MKRRPRVIDRTLIYQGRVIRLMRETFEIGGRRMTRETIQHPGAVVIVPVLDRARLLFVRQYRRAIDRVLLEFPAGTLEPGEAREACARRELEEETGYRASRLRHIAQFYAAPGVMSEQMTLYLAEDVQRGTAAPEPDEFIRPMVLPLETALERIDSGTICDAKTIIGVLLAQRLLARRRR